MSFRVSNVEAFRQWRDDEDAELDSLLDKLRGTFQPTPAMLAGTAFHKALEESKPGDEADTLTALGHTFLIRANISLHIPEIREVRADKAYIVDGSPIRISGQLDTISGKQIEDHKTTARFDPERFIGGYQWRLYLDIFGADVFRWNVFEMAPVEADDMPANTWEVFAFHQLSQYRYPGLHADCQSLVDDFARFVRSEEALIRSMPIAA